MGAEVAVTGTGTGVGIYYGTQSQNQKEDKKTVKPEEKALDENQEHDKERPVPSSTNSGREPEAGVSAAK